MKGGPGAEPTTLLFQALLEVGGARASHLIPKAGQWVLAPRELVGQPLPRKSLWPVPSLLACLCAQCVLFCFQGREQDVSRIIQALNECLAALPRQQLRKVCGIGVSGQMHGVMFWKTGQGMLGSGGGHMLPPITAEPGKSLKGLCERSGHPTGGCNGTCCLLYFVYICCVRVSNSK